MIRPPERIHHLIEQMKQAVMARGRGEGVNSLVVGVTLLTLVLLLMETGYQVHWGWWHRLLTRSSECALLGIYGIDIAGKWRRLPDRWGYFRRRPLDWVIGGALLAALLVPSVSTFNLLISVVLYRQVVVLADAAIRSFTGETLLANVQLRPAQMLALSFFITILAGGYLLTLPAATVDGQGASWLNALFTSTSATCVTGLIVVDTANYWSRFGQTVILALIQVGALGIMTLSTSAALIFGKKLGLRRRVVLQDIFDESMAENLTQLIRYIVKLTFSIEAIGTVLLFIKFNGPGIPLPEAVFQAVFHAVSAFCNAGFALFSENLMGYAHDLMVSLTISTLVVLGGLGYTVLAGLFVLRPFRQSLRLSWKTQSLHTKLALTTTAFLISVGTILIFFFEFDNTLLHLPLGDQLLAAYFQSVTTRTAGFNTIDFSRLSHLTLFIMMILMFIGASSGSTGGGIKTTTVAVLVLSVRSILQGREQVEAFGRTIPQQVVYKATSIAVVSLGLLLMLFFLLMLGEPHPFLPLAFEAVSAFGTVGLSTGLTPLLTAWGKLVIIVMMYVGRLGPLTLALAIGEPKPRAAIMLPEGRVLVG